MSTICVVRKNGQVAIAADTMAKWGYRKESSSYIVNHEKIHKVGDNYIGICGPTSLKIAISNFFSLQRNSLKLNKKENIFSTWTHLHEYLKEKCFLKPDEDEDDSVESTRINALIANPSGIFGVSSLRVVQEFTKFYSYGAGIEFAMGAMYGIYNLDNYTAEQIATIGVEAACEFDDATGSPVISYSLPLRSTMTQKKQQKRK
jgi:ATP-dependent HslUV protease, peptidase subunit HslV